MDERAIVEALKRFDDLWGSLYPAEQARITRLLVGKVTVGSSGIAIDLRHQGIGRFVRDIASTNTREAAA